jgi:geranylgeranyl diphosphate synthase type 3
MAPMADGRCPFQFLSPKRVSAMQRHEYDESLLESFRYIQAIPGKDVRGKLIDCFQLWFHAPDDKVQVVKSIISDLHNASLLVDDIEDRSVLRRGVPVAHSVFGVPVVINTANYMYFRALEQCHALQCPESMNVFVSELLNLHRGQGRDIQWREDQKCPTQEQYMQMILDKTGGLFRLAVGMLQPLATSQEAVTADYVPLINDLSIYFQIRDDLLNLVDPDTFHLKSFAEDLTEGKFSYPVVHNLQMTEQRMNETKQRDTRILSILMQRTNDVEVKRYAIEIMRQEGSLLHTREMCREYLMRSLAEIEKLGGNPGLLKLIGMLDQKLVELDEKGVLLPDRPPEAAAVS